MRIDPSKNKQSVDRNSHHLYTIHSEDLQNDESCLGEGDLYHESPGVLQHEGK